MHRVLFLRPTLGQLGSSLGPKFFQKFGSYPRGSKYPNSRVLGPKVHTLNGFWTLKPYHLGTWTLRVLYPEDPSAEG